MRRVTDRSVSPNKYKGNRIIDLNESNDNEFEFEGEKKDDDENHHKSEKIYIPKCEEGLDTLSADSTIFRPDDSVITADSLKSLKEAK